MSARTTSPFTYEDFVHFPDDGQRYELVDGEVYVTPAPSTRHQEIVIRVARSIADHLDRHGGGRVFLGPVDIVLSDTNVVEPDVVFMAAADVRRITTPNIQGPPTLAVEVLSDPRHDRVRKRRLYARFGVAEYWLVDPDADRVEVHRLPEGAPAAGLNAVDEYPTPTILEPGATLTSDLLPGLEIDVADLLAEAE